MKQLLSLLAAVLLIFPVIANAQDIQEGPVTLGKSSMPGFTYTSQYSQDDVEAVLAKKLVDAGVELHKKKNKFYTYNGVLLREISPNKIDLYYKVEKKKKRSVVYFSVSKGYDNHVSSGSDATATANIKHFLADIDATIQHNEEVKDKQAEMEKANEKLEKQKEELRKAEEETNRKARELEDMKNKK